MARKSSRATESGMRLEFWGATREVTGSAFLLRAGAPRVWSPQYGETVEP